MEYLVDGYNVILPATGKVLAPDDLEREREALIRKVAPLRSGGQAVVVVFDGGQHSQPTWPLKGRSSVRALFTAPGRSADDWIIDRVRNAEKPKDIMVVSDDGELARKCRQLGARTMGAEGLDAALRRRPAPTGEKPDRVNLQEDLEFFKRHGIDLSSE